VNHEANKSIIRRLYKEVFGDWDLSVIDELIGPDFLGHGVPAGTPRGPEGFRQFYASLRAAFPDLRYTVEDMIAENDRVVVRWRWEGTHQGRFKDIAPTGKRASMTGIAIYRLAGGKAVERWVEVGMESLLRQLREQ
jgi:predicted ester cyclase